MTSEYLKQPTDTKQNAIEKFNQKIDQLLKDIELEIKKARLGSCHFDLFNLRQYCKQLAVASYNVNTLKMEKETPPQVLAPISDAQVRNLRRTHTRANNR